MKEKEEEKEIMPNDSASSDSVDDAAPSENASQIVDTNMIKVELEGPKAEHAPQEISDPGDYEEPPKKRRSFFCCGKRKREDSP